MHFEEKNGIRYTEYAGFARNEVGTEEILFTTSCSAVLAKERSLERIQFVNGYLKKMFYDPESLVIRQRNAEIKYGEWEDLKDGE